MDEGRTNDDHSQVLWRVCGKAATSALDGFVGVWSGDYRDAQSSGGLTTFSRQPP